MRYLIPLTLQERYYAAIEAEIRRIFDKLIYRPLLDILGMHLSALDGYEIKNTANVLLDAIMAGTVWYEDGQFKGRFNARISLILRRIGAVFNAKSRTWSLPRELLTPEISMAQAAADNRYRALQHRMLDTLAAVDVSDVDKISDTDRKYERTLDEMDKDIKKTLPASAPETALSRVIIEANLTDEQKKIIAEEWGENLDLYIKGWAQDNIIKLREQIQPHVLAGGRAQGLVKTIQENYGVGIRKAKFLARQETALLMSKFQETRYTGIGIQRYRWSSAHDRRVRHDHHLLDGNIYRFDSPPVTNRKTGARNNPGQDYNCRCVAIPIVE